MLPRTAHPLSLRATAAPTVHPAPAGRVLHYTGSPRPEGADVAFHPDVLPLVPESPLVEHEPAYGACLPRQADIVCAENATCICPLSDHVTDAERAVMNDISRQASRLATVLSWLFALAALAALVLLLLR
ncbi:hypothetical protein [Microlunatus antarcticus]|uniref:Uncharacterized protein n=1 Tax=Microlunatus antarcticus TaxID=53388 RepID=A0A7W5P8J6_9ACTN|nr:hypothetical protein [Microlunatus antarcticus]MBB3328640.1 hypothetical protein [Microlunatus antarcticus]